MVNKLLLPNGKSMTENQIMRLNMKEVFKHLKTLNISDDLLYKDHLNQSRPKSRPRSRSRSKYDYEDDDEDYKPRRKTSRKRSRSRKTEQYYWIYNADTKKGYGSNCYSHSDCRSGYCSGGRCAMGKPISNPYVNPYSAPAKKWPTVVPYTAPSSPISCNSYKTDEDCGSKVKSCIWNMYTEQCLNR